MGIVFKNNAASALSANATNSTTTLAVVNASEFPDVSAAGDYFYATIFDVNGNIEVVRVNGRNIASNRLTVVRGQESTTARAWATSAHATVELRLTTQGIRDTLNTLSFVPKPTAADNGKFLSVSSGSAAWVNRPSVSITRPGPPTNLLAFGVTGNQLSVTWNDPTSGSSPTSYRWRIRENTSSGTFSSYSRVTANRFTATGLDANTQYVIEVLSSNSAGDSLTPGQLLARTLTTVPTTQAPGAPRNLLIFGHSTSSLSVTWDDPAAGSGGTPTGYKWRIRKGNNAWGNLTTVTSNRAVASGLDPNSAYTFGVVATNDGGDSAEVTATGSTEAQDAAVQPPGSPTNLRALDISQTTIIFAWGVPSSGDDPDRYEYRYGLTTGSYGDITNTEETCVEITGLSASTTYRLQVRARNTGGVSAWTTSSNTDTASPDPAPTVDPPGAPTNPRAIDRNTNSIIFGWTPPTSGGVATSYKWRYREGNSGYGAESTTRLTFVSVTGLDPETSYTLQVRASNTGGDSSRVTSADVLTTAVPVTPTVEVTKPGPPTNPLAFGQTTSAISVTWNDPDSGSPPTGYWWRQKKGSGAFGEYTAVTANRFTATGLDTNSEYTFEILARNSAGNSTTAASVTSRTAAAAVAATRPGAPTNLRSFAATATSLSFAWSDPNSGDPPTSFEWSSRENGGNYVADTSTEENCVEITGLDADTTYDFRVRARNDQGVSGYASLSSVSTGAELRPGPPYRTSGAGFNNPNNFGRDFWPPITGLAASSYEARVGQGTSVDNVGTWTEWISMRSFANGGSSADQIYFHENDPVPPTSSDTHNAAYPMSVRVTNIAGTPLLRRTSYVLQLRGVSDSATGSTKGEPVSVTVRTS